MVSMVSWELFEEQDDSYKQSVLPADVKARVSIEVRCPTGSLLLAHFGIMSSFDQVVACSEQENLVFACCSAQCHGADTTKASALLSSSQLSATCLTQFLTTMCATRTTGWLDLRLGQVCGRQRHCHRCRHLRSLSPRPSPVQAVRHQQGRHCERRQQNRLMISQMAGRLELIFCLSGLRRSSRICCCGAAAPGLADDGVTPWAAAVSTLGWD